MNTEKNPTTGLIVELFGPTLEFLTLPEDEQNDFCVLKGVIPPGVFVPLHSHPDTEDFIVLSGEIEVLKQTTRSYEWIVAKAGDYIHVPGGRGTPGATSLTNLWSTSSPRPINWENSFRRREDR